MTFFSVSYLFLLTLPDGDMIGLMYPVGVYVGYEFNAFASGPVMSEELPISL